MSLWPPPAAGLSSSCGAAMASPQCRTTLVDAASKPRDRSRQDRRGVISAKLDVGQHGFRCWLQAEDAWQAPCSRFLQWSFPYRGRDPRPAPVRRSRVQLRLAVQAATLGYGLGLTENMRRAKRDPRRNNRNPKGLRVSKTTRTRAKVRQSRALGIALTPKAARYLEKRPYAPASTAAPSTRATATTPSVCARSSVCAPSTAFARNAARHRLQGGASPGRPDR